VAAPQRNLVSVGDSLEGWGFTAENVSLGCWLELSESQSTARALSSGRWKRGEPESADTVVCICSKPDGSPTLPGGSVARSDIDWPKLGIDRVRRAHAHNTRQPRDRFSNRSFMRALLMGALHSLEESSAANSKVALLLSVTLGRKNYLFALSEAEKLIEQLRQKLQIAGLKVLVLEECLRLRRIEKYGAARSYPTTSWRRRNRSPGLVNRKYKPRVSVPSSKRRHGDGGSAESAPLPSRTSELASRSAASREGPRLSDRAVLVQSAQHRDQGGLVPNQFPCPRDPDEPMHQRLRLFTAPPGRCQWSIICHASWLAASPERRLFLLRHPPKADCTPSPRWRCRRLPREDDRPGRKTLACRSGPLPSCGTE